MPTPPFDTTVAHRWFAVECNNFAWDLIEATNHSPDDTERMIHAAHAALHHWQAIGTPLNRLRAYCLLAAVYAAAGNGPEAVRYADTCLRLTEEVGDTQTAFDRAAAYGSASRAYAIAGNLDRARDYYTQAVAVADTFEDADDRAVFDRFYPAP